MKTKFLTLFLTAIASTLTAAVYQPGGGGSTTVSGSITGAYSFNAGFTVVNVTNVALTPVLSNQLVTGISPGATNASFYVGSSSGKGTNIDFWLPTEFFGD